MHQEGGLARRRRALERRRGDADDDPPPSEVGEHVAQAKRRPRCRTRGRPRAGPAWPPDPDRRRAPRPGCRPRTSRSVLHPLRPGRWPSTSARTKRTPGLTTSSYGCSTAPGVGAPEHHVQLREAEDEALDPCRSSTTSTSSPNSSDSRVENSRPPKPAPRITIRIAEAYPRSPPISHPVDPPWAVDGEWGPADAERQARRPAVP